jgi:hypothetical protein
LRELIATRLGRPQALAVEVQVDSDPGAIKPDASELTRADAARDALALALDWSMSLVGAVPVAVHAARNGPPADGFELNVEFRRPAAGGVAPTAIIRLAAKSTGVFATDIGMSIALRANVECAHGKALLAGPQDVRWDLAGEQFVESLTSDRPGIEVMLDHFCRRVVGGLIPVPTLEDLCRAYQLVDSAFAS